MTYNIKTKELTAHLRRHAIPELIDDKCLAALDNIDAQYGEESTHVAILEVRLGEEARYIDYVIFLDEKNISIPSPMWYEFDYEQFASGKKIEPCLFFSTGEPTAEDYREIFDKTLPVFLGEDRARKLRKQFEKIVRILPKGSYIKHIGTMSGRGELETARLVVDFKGRENICKFLAEMNWKGNLEALWEIIKTWNGQNYLSLDFDLGEDYISEKIGLEITVNAYHPVIVDRYITRLEQMGLCLKSKGDALRHWIRIPPDADPFIQTQVQYFKLNFLDGKIIEAKAYLEQSPYILHHYFNNYDRPLYVEFMLKDEKNTLSIGKSMKYLYDCEAERIRRIHFLGDVAGYEHLDRLLAECQSEGLFTSIEISDKVTRKQLREMINDGASEFVTELENISALKILQELGFKNVRVKCRMDKIEEATELAEKFGTAELIITCNEVLERKEIERVAEFIKNYAGQLKLTVDSCFSILRAFMGGAEVRRNNNRGIERGCTAGRDHFCITATGKFSPCSVFGAEEEFNSLKEYWEKSPVLEKFRTMEKSRESSCKGCCYERRCLPCPALREKISDCPIQELR